MRTLSTIAAQQFSAASITSTSRNARLSLRATAAPENSESVMMSRSSERRCRRCMATAVPPISTPETPRRHLGRPWSKRDAAGRPAHRRTSRSQALRDSQGGVKPACRRPRCPHPLSLRQSASVSTGSAWRAQARAQRISSVDEGLGDQQTVPADAERVRGRAGPEVVPELWRHAVAVEGLEARHRKAAQAPEDLRSTRSVHVSLHSLARTCLWPHAQARVSRCAQPRRSRSRRQRLVWPDRDRAQAATVCEVALRTARWRSALRIRLWDSVRPASNCSERGDTASRPCADHRRRGRSGGARGGGCDSSRRRRCSPRAGHPPQPAGVATRLAVTDDTPSRRADLLGSRAVQGRRGQPLPRRELGGVERRAGSPGEPSSAAAAAPAEPRPADLEDARRRRAVGANGHRRAT